jgi:Carboxypeptidase regulatory-like domain/TonB-dependent Receptor Plug Domain
MFRSNRLFGVLLCMCMFGALCGSKRLFAQVGTGIISGTVTDSAGASLAGAAVTIKNTQTGVVTPVSVNDQGRYLAPDLIVGSYDVQAQMKGFQTQVHHGVMLTVGSDIIVDFALRVGQITETVMVEGASTQVETTSAEISALVGQEQMQDLPLNGRNFEQLILLAPGVQSVTTGTQNSFYGRAPSYSIAGSRPEGQELLLDGANIQGFWDHGAGNSIIGTSLGVEAIGEFQVLTNSYSARFGGSGSVMNATTRSGTNTFHGEVYDFFRNDVLDARNFFNTVGLAKDPFRQNQFGGTLGGPIKKDKMFFFVNYEGIRQLLGTTVLPTVPDALARQGEVPCAVAANLPCNGGIATVPVNPASQAILNLYPAAVPGAPNFIGDLGNGIAQIALSGVQPANEDYVNTRWDYVLSPTDTIFARYVFDNGALTQPFSSALGLYPEQSKGRNQYITIGDKKIFSSNLVNDARFSFVRTNMRAFTTVSYPALQFFSYYGEDRQDGSINVPGISGIGPSDFTPDYEIQNTYAVADDIVWVHGKHTFEIGLEFRRLQSPLSNGFFDDQGWTFPNLVSFLEGKPVSPTDPPITLLGALPGKSNSSRSFREWDLFPYIQDTWKVARKVTLNLGLRYDFISNPTEIHNELCAFIDPSNPATTGCTPVSHVFPSNPSVKSLDPRVGIAWDPFEDHKTSIRAGAGVFHDPIQVRNYHPAYLFAGPYQTAVSVCVFGGPPCSYPVPFQGITEPIPTIGEALEYDPGTTPFILQYNFGVQREILHNTILSVSYVGSRGYNLLVQNDLNPIIPVIDTNGQLNFVGTDPGSPSNVPTVRKNPNLGALAFNVPDGSSWYNSLQVYVTRNAGKSLQFQAAYTYSKCIDYGSISYGLESDASDQQAQSDPYDLARDKGPCDFDVKHNFVGNVIYAFPFRGNRLVEGWQTSAIVTARSGGPFSVQDGFDQVGLNDPAGQPGERPNLVAGQSNNPIVGRVNEWYNPAAFVLQPLGELGNLARNTLVGPKFVDFDLSLSKNTRLKENMSLEFRVEAFNIFNHPNFGLPNQTLFSGVGPGNVGIPNPSAGQITTTVGTSRQLQLALKLRF